MRIFDKRNIIAEDEQILVVYKPSGIAVQNKGAGEMDLEHMLLNYLASKLTGREREIPYLAVVHSRWRDFWYLRKQRKPPPFLRARYRNICCIKNIWLLRTGLRQRPWES